MRMLSKRRVKELVLYSPQPVVRLEAAGKFPKRVKLGYCRGSVGWRGSGAQGRNRTTDTRIFSLSVIYDTVCCWL